MASDRCKLLCLDLEVAEQLRLHRLTLRDAERAAGQARALADPTRLVLAAALGKAEELCVCDLAWVVERSQNLVSHHLRALRAARLVSSRRAGRWSCTRSRGGRRPRPPCSHCGLTGTCGARSGSRFLPAGSLSS